MTFSRSWRLSRRRYHDLVPEGGRPGPTILFPCLLNTESGLLLAIGVGFAPFWSVPLARDRAVLLGLGCPAAATLVVVVGPGAWGYPRVVFDAGAGNSPRGGWEGGRGFWSRKTPVRAEPARSVEPPSLLDRLLVPH